MHKFIVGIVMFGWLAASVLADESSSSKEQGSGVFLGIDYFDGETEITRDISSAVTLKEDFDHAGVRLKLGVQDQNNIRFQGYIKIDNLEDEIPGLSSDGKIYGFGADALFTFPTSSNFTPYILVGMSSDFAELDDPGVEYSQDTLRAFALKAGLGGLVKINKHVEFQAGYDMHYRLWQDIEIEGLAGVSEVEQHDVSKSFHVGLNFFF